jgi:signal transduction histidine kinase
LPFCDVSQTLPITLYGTPSGALTVCRTYQGIIREGLSSSVFLILTFIGLSFLFWIDRRNQMEKSRLESTYQTAIALEQLARQVAHDIRSPVGALQVLSSNLAKLADTTPIKPQVELLNHATLRIQKIADDLLLRENSNDKKLKTPSLPHTLLQLNPATVIATVRNIIQEKQLLLTNPHSASLSGNENRTTILDLKILDLSNATIDHSSKSNSDSDLGRVLSNLIQNALEVPRAEGKSCLVDVELDLNDPNGYIIRIKDNGLGIDKSNSRHLGRTGFSFGKIRGVGLGVSHARRWVQERRGQLTFKTAREVGTEVTLTLPR